MSSDVGLEMRALEVGLATAREGTDVIPPSWELCSCRWHGCLTVWHRWWAPRGCRGKRAQFLSFRLVHSVHNNHDIRRDGHHDRFDLIRLSITAWHLSVLLRNLDKRYRLHVWGLFCTLSEHCRRSILARNWDLERPVDGNVFRLGLARLLDRVSGVLHLWHQLHGPRTRSRRRRRLHRHVISPRLADDGNPIVERRRLRLWDGDGNGRETRLDRLRRNGIHPGPFTGDLLRCHDAWGDADQIARGDPLRVDDGATGLWHREWVAHRHTCNDCWFARRGCERRRVHPLLENKTKTNYTKWFNLLWLTSTSCYKSLWVLNWYLNSTTNSITKHSYNRKLCFGIMYIYINLEILS